MALDTERTTTSAGPWDALKSGVQRAFGPLGGFANAGRAMGAWLANLRVVRFFSASLLRRILVTNLIGLGIMIGGIHYQSQYHAWLVDAKSEALKIQGEILAGAIASEAKVAKGGGIELDTRKLAGGAAQRAPFRDDAFAALEMSIRPERVTPILRRLIQPTKNRARVYDRDGSLVVDTTTFLSRGQITRQEPDAATDDKPKTRNFWTRLKSWLIDKDLPVYKEIGGANGTAYPEVRAALKGEPNDMLLLSEKGEQIVSVAVPIRRFDSVQGVLLLSTQPGEIDRILAEEQSLIWTLASIALLATLVTSFLLARTVADPMRRLSEAAEHVSRNISARQELPDYSDRSDEVGQMAGAFKSMTAALYRRIEASESFAADVAHELKNPLTAARSTAESLTYAKSDAQRNELVKQIQFEIKRLNRLITDVSNASRLDAELARQPMQPVNVTTVVASVSQIFRDILSDDTRRVVTKISAGQPETSFTVNGVEGRIGQVLTNLVDNAISFSPEGGSVTLEARHSGPVIELIVEDEGPGITEDRLQVIFDRFYTDRPATEATRGKNSGLGLSISREIVMAHGGKIWAENRAPLGDRKGARFVVQLPALATATRGGTTIGRRS